MSSIQLDGSQTRARNGGEEVGYQGRKKAKTTNALFLCDNNGQPLVLSTPQSGEHHDLYDIELLMNEMCDLLKSANIDVDGVFLNADSGFDSAQLRDQCELYVDKYALQVFEYKASFALLIAVASLRHLAK